MRYRLRLYAPASTGRDLGQHRAGLRIVVSVSSPASGRSVLSDYPASDTCNSRTVRAQQLGCRLCPFQARQIGGICAALGAAYGSWGVTSTSGPGISLKSEALGLCDD